MHWVSCGVDKHPNNLGWHVEWRASCSFDYNRSLSLSGTSCLFIGQNLVWMICPMGYLITYRHDFDETGCTISIFFYATSEKFADKSWALMSHRINKQGLPLFQLYFFPLLIRINKSCLHRPLTFTIFEQRMFWFLLTVFSVRLLHTHERTLKNLFMPAEIFCFSRTRRSWRGSVCMPHWAS